MQSIEWLDSTPSTGSTTAGVSDDRILREFETPGGKKIMITFDDVYGLIEIRFRTGGERPKEFDGKFTTIAEAERSVRQYLQRKTPVVPQEPVTPKPMAKVKAKHGPSKRK